MFVSDLRHFFEMPDDAPGPACKMAEQLGNVVRAATRRRGRYGLGERLAVPPAAGTEILPGSHRRLPARPPSPDRVALRLVWRRGRDQRLGGHLL